MPKYDYKYWFKSDVLHPLSLLGRRKAPFWYKAIIILLYPIWLIGVFVQDFIEALVWFKNNKKKSTLVKNKGIGMKRYFILLLGVALIVCWVGYRKGWFNPGSYLKLESSTETQRIYKGQVYESLETPIWLEPGYLVEIVCDDHLFTAYIAGQTFESARYHDKFNVTVLACPPDIVQHLPEEYKKYPIVLLKKSKAQVDIYAPTTNDGKPITIQLTATVDTKCQTLLESKVNLKKYAEAK